MADYIRPTPRNPILGLLADALTGGVEWMRSPQRAQQMQGIGGLLAETGIPATMERLSYGEPLTKGRGMTTRLRPEAEAALMTLGPEAVPIGRGAMAAVRATKGLPVGAATVYHGSPYRFQRFDPTKIGSGEGAQAYGYGHYVAESPDVAKSYQSALSADRGFSFGGKSGLTRTQVQEMVDKKYGPGYLDNVIRPSGVADSFIDDMVTGVMRGEGSYPRQYKPGSQRAKIYDELRGKITHADPGSLYTIDLPDPAIARMLDYDRPFSQQTPEVRKMLQDAEIVGKDDWLISGMKGREIYNRASFGAPVKLPLRQQDDQIFASQRLREAGIPGIRYLDQGSRGAGAGTSNFVVFPGEEDLLRILSVNGGLLGP
jgi:hypothetical protein